MDRDGEIDERGPIKIGPGLRAAIVHYGEGAEPDEGHRSHRAGRLAALLADAGVSVTRIVPSFRDWDGFQRPEEWTGTDGREGRLVIIPTRSYTNTRGRDRAGSLLDFNRGVRRYLAANVGFDLVMAGFPPPGLLRGITAADPGAATIADIRDLWPDALLPEGSIGRFLGPVATLAGRALARELNRADAVVALSATMLRRAPSGAARTEVIPIGFEPSTEEDRKLWPTDPAPMSACYVGSMNQLFDLDAMLRGWLAYVEHRQSVGPSPVLTVVGDGDQRPLVDSLVGSEPTVHLAGWVPGNEVGAHLHAADLGLTPTRSGHGTTISNKVSEYLAAGMYVLNTLNPEVGRPLEERGLGHRFESEPAAWAAAFERSEKRLSQIRADRAERLAEGDRQYGAGPTNEAWLDLIGEVLTARRASSSTLSAG